MALNVSISVKDQNLTLLDQEKPIKVYSVSTAKNGVGMLKDSGKTPLGWHVIRAKIGAGLPCNTVFVGRRPTGEILTPDLFKKQTERDWILSRILWLSGLEVGKNRLGKVDSMQRYIYIHGAPDGVKMGQPGSKGCIRMKNLDIIELFDWVEPGTKVYIHQD